MAKRRLTAKQFQVLQWIADGHPDGIFPEYSGRVSARSLAGYGLVTIQGRGATWQASLTESGQKRLEAGPDYDPANPTVKSTRGVSYLLRPAPSISPEPSQPQISELDYWILGVRNETGQILVDTPHNHKELEALTRQIVKSPVRPRGHTIKFESVPWVQRKSPVGRWIRYFPDEVDEKPVPVPETVGRYHPIAKEFRDSKTTVSPEHAIRAARIIHAIIKEAEARGYRVEAGEPLNISIGPDQTRLTMREMPLNGGTKRPFRLEHGS